MCIRTERVNYNSVYLLGRKLISIQNCKSIVAMVFMCYFILMYVCKYGLLYNVMMMSVLQDVRKRVNKRNILHFTFQKEDQFPRTISGSMFTRFASFDIGMASIIMYCLD